MPGGSNVPPTGVDRGLRYAAASRCRAMMSRSQETTDAVT
jgi:hypothetical protein